MSTFAHEAGSTVHNRRRLLRLTAGGGVALAAALAGQKAGAQHSQTGAIVGSWFLEITSEAFEPRYSLLTANDNGTLIAAPDLPVVPDPAASFGTSGHGAWAHAAGNRYLFTFLSLAADAQWTFSGLAKVRGALTVDESGNTFTGPFTVTFTLPDGTLVFEADGTVDGTRIGVDYG